MSNKPLQYESLKTVIQHMEPSLRFVLALRIPSIRLTEKVVPIHIEHLRFLLARRIPSIRNVEKIVPLHVRRLSFDNLKTQINDTVYSLGVYRKYPDGERVPEEHQRDNDEGGVIVDLDEFGFRDSSSEGITTPGDVELRTGAELEVDQWRDGVFQNNYERHIEVYEKALAQRLALGEADDLQRPMEPGRHANRVEFLFPEDGEDFDNEEEDDEEHMLNRLRQLSIKDLKEAIVEYQDMLVPYYCRWNNVAPPFTPLIQLTIDSQSGKQIHRYAYNMKLFEAWKSLNTMFFGNRRHIIQARLLTVMPYQVFPIRLPVGFKVKVKRLEMGNIALDGLKSIVEDSSFPLNRLYMSHCENNVVVYEDDVVKTAKELHIKSLFYHEQPFLPLLMALQNQHVFLKFYEWTFLVDDQLRLIEHWIQTEKPVGTCLVYYQAEKETCKDMLAQAKDQFNGEMNDDRHLRLPMSHNKELEVFYNRNEEVVEKKRMPYLGFVEHEKPKWNVTMRVVKQDVEEEKSS